MSVIPFGRAVELVTERSSDDRWKLGLESIESGTGRLNDVEGDYSGEGVAFEVGDLLFGKLRPYLAKSWLATQPGAAVGDFHVYRARQATADPRFLKYLLLSSSFLDPIVSSVYGAKMPRASWDFVRSVAIHVPSMELQAAIADYLDRETAQIDMLIAKQEQLIDLLRLRRTSFRSTIVEGQNTRMMKLKNLFEPSSQTSAGGEEVLSVFREFGIVPKSSKEGNNNRTPEDVSRYLIVQPGDLVVNKMKAWQGSLGISKYSGIVSGDYEVARPISSLLDADYAHAVLRSARRISEYALGSTGIRPSQWRLYWPALSNVEIPVPPLEKQLKIVARLDAETAKIDALIAKAEQFIALSKERRAALITAAVTGQLEIPGVAA